MNPLLLKWFVTGCFIGVAILIGIGTTAYAISRIRAAVAASKRRDTQLAAILDAVAALSTRLGEIERANRKAEHFAEALHNEYLGAKKAATAKQPEQSEPVTVGTYAITPIAVSLARLAKNIEELGDYSPGPFAGARLVLTSFKYVVDGLRALDAELKLQHPVNQRSATSHDSFAAMVAQRSTPQKPNSVTVPPADTVCVCCKQPATRYCPGWDNSGDLLEPCGGLAMRKSCGEPLCNECAHLLYTDRHVSRT